jgi:hypothetical protein
MIENLNDHIWEDFEATKTGRLRIGGTWFYMRVGLFMNRPTQVIQTHGEFVKMRLAPWYDKKDLHVLDASNNRACLYTAGLSNTYQWRPPIGAFAENWGDIIRTTLRNRTGELSKTILKNNALLMKLSKRP